MPGLLQAARLPLYLAGCLAAAFLAGSIAFAAQHPQAGSKPGQAPASAAPDPALHGHAWAFGQSAGRKDALWHKGLDGDDVSRRATPAQKRKPAVDTSGGINRALNAAKNRGEVGVSMKDQSSAWKVEPNAMRADEFKPRDRRHVVRAYAGVKAGDDLDINIGPEIILRDERVGEETAHEKQPNSSLGVGMHFKYDF